jgi:hypothetical protein
MPIDLPKSENLPSGDLARTVNHEANDEWPTYIEVVAYYGKDRKGKRKSVTVSADQFFGRGGYNAPMTGDQFIQIVEKLRRS